MSEQSSSAPRGPSFRKGNSGNPKGRPRGARNRTTLAVEALLDGEAEAITRKAIELALGGDRAALRICLDRILPPSRERRISFALPHLRSPQDSVQALAAITAAVASGEITLSEAAEMGKLVELFIKALEYNDFDLRLRLLEGDRSKPLEARQNATKNGAPLGGAGDMPVWTETSGYASSPKDDA